MFRVPAIVLVLLCALSAPLSAQTARLLVTVVDRTTGVSIPDVRVQIFREDPPPATRWGSPIGTNTLIASAQTDALGTAVISVKTFYRYLVRATHKQYLPTEPEFLPIRASEGDVEVAINLFPVDFILPPVVGETLEIVKGRLVGQVSSPTGEALSNIRILAQQSASGRNGDTRTGDDGSYSLALVPGDYTIYAVGDLAAPIPKQSSQDFRAYPVTEHAKARIVAGRRTRADIVLNPVRSVSVTVLVTDDLGQRVSNADVFALSERGNSSAMLAGLTGEEGSVKIGPTTPGEVGLLVHATKDDRYLIGKAKIEIQDRPLIVTMSLVPSGIIIGRVEFVGRVDPLHSSGGMRVMQTVPGSVRRRHSSMYSTIFSVEPISYVSRAAMYSTEWYVFMYAVWKATIA